VITRASSPPLPLGRTGRPKR